MPPIGFETTISAGERPKTYALDRAATGIGIKVIMKKLNIRENFYISLNWNNLRIKV